MCSAAGRVLLYAALAQCLAVLASHEDDTQHSVDAFWDFDGGLEGWGNSTAEEMHCELHPRGGELRGSIQGRDPHLDSPVFRVPANDKHYIVVRMMYQGPSARAVWTVRTESRIPTDLQARSARQGRDDWTATAHALDVPFAVIGDGRFRTYYVSLWEYYSGVVTQLRLHPAVADEGHERSDEPHKSSPGLGQSFAVDWVRIAKAPTIQKVEGCIDKYFETPHLGSGPTEPGHFPGFMTTRADGHFVHRGSGGGVSNISMEEAWTNDDRHVNRHTTFSRRSDLAFATTFNCLRDGGERITITGINFGVFDSSWSAEAETGDGFTATVTVRGRPCVDVVASIPQRQLTCTLPPWRFVDGSDAVPVGGDVYDVADDGFRTLVDTGFASRAGDAAGAVLGLERVAVTVTNGALPGLADTKPYLSYAVPPPPPLAPTVSNVAARSMDLSWTPPVDFWDAVTVTGYVIVRRVEGTVVAFGHPVYVGNVTTTTLIDLEPDTSYEFRIAAMNEDQVNVGGGLTDPKMEWLQLDLYGRRPAVAGALVGDFSNASIPTATLVRDFAFLRFDANATLAHGAVDKRTTEGPTRNRHGEGHYGLLMVGECNIQGCNSSHACCDGFTTEELDMFGAPRVATVGVAGCRDICTAIGDVQPWYVNGESSRNITSNTHGNGIKIGSGLQTVLASGGYNISGACGPALRLTGPRARSSGSAWYPRQMNVREGFETTFTFRVSNPSYVCAIMDDVYTHCRSRGADGFAFVVQNQDGMALGMGGYGLGYEGIKNSIAIEFDTYYNPELLDPWENHISVQTRGWRHENSANHTYALATMAGGPEIADGTHTVKIRYSPAFDEDILFTSKFAATPWVTHYIDNADWVHGGLGDWGTGMGTLQIFVDDMMSPLLALPLNLDASLHLNSGRAWVGFTAATGEERWQVHDILRWDFSSLRIDVPYHPPPIVNGDGAAECSCADLRCDECVHP